MKIAPHTVIEFCRLCGSSDVETYLNMGYMALPRWPKEGEVVPYAPIELCRCEKCGLVQLGHTVEPDELFRDYWYRSGATETMRKHLRELASSARNNAHLTKGDTVIDIGSNDGTFLGNFDGDTLNLVGYEPAGIWDNHGAHIIHPNYFDSTWPHKAKLITSIAMFYDVDDPNAFVADIAETMTNDGMWVCEVNDLSQMIANMAFDQICHEHLTYWDEQTFRNLVARHGLKVKDVETNSINGGSIRFYVVKGKEDAAPYGYSKHLFERFLGRMIHLQEQAEAFFERKRSLWALGASTRGLTTLHWFGLDHKKIDAVVERNPEKVGRYYGDTGIKVYNEEAFRKVAPEYTLVLPYSFMEEIKQREAAYLKSGGKFLMPVPELREVSLVA